MFSELPKLFGRNFMMAFFLPVMMVMTTSVLILGQYGVVPSIVDISLEEILLGVTGLSALSWIGGILLVAVNRDLYRLMEGYGNLNPLRLITWIQKKKYRRMQNEKSRLDLQYLDYEEKGAKFPSNLQSRRDVLMQDLVEQFPDEEQWVLPTAFGNTVRAFEVYPRVMYGVEAISVWSHLLAIMPSEFRGLIDDAKTQVDFWLDLGTMGFLLMIEYIGLAILTDTIRAPWAIAIGILLISIPPYRARRNAIEWGDLVKVAFDIYRFPLLDAMGLDRPISRKSERCLWTRISEALTYQDSSILPELKRDSKPKKK